MASWILDKFPEIINIINKMVSSDYIFYSTDTSKFLWMDESVYEARTKPGDELNKQSVSARVLESRKPLTTEIDAGLYGVALKMTGIPIFDDEKPDKLIGTVGVMVRRNNANTLRNATETYHKGMEEISAAIEETAAAASDINASEQKLNQEIISIRDTANEIVKILDYIRSIADETKMLGLNAAIEAARAGEQGRGFGVVASEIRKLSEYSKETANQIKKLTQQIEGNIAVALQGSQVTLKASEEQAAASEEITASVQELTSMLEEIKKVAYSI